MAWSGAYKHKQNRKRTATAQLQPTVSGGLVAYPAVTEDRYVVTARATAEPSLAPGALGSYCGVTGYIEDIETTWLYDKRFPDGGAVTLETTVTIRADITSVA